MGAQVFHLGPHASRRRGEGCGHPSAGDKKRVTTPDKIQSWRKDFFCSVKNLRLCPKGDEGDQSEEFYRRKANITIYLGFCLSFVFFTTRVVLFFLLFVCLKDLFMYISVLPAYMKVHSIEALGGKNNVPGSLKLELQAVVSHCAKHQTWILFKGNQ